MKKNTERQATTKEWQMANSKWQIRGWGGPKRHLALGAVIAGMLLLGTMALAADAPPGTTEDQISSYKVIGLSIAAAVSVGASILGAGYAVGRIGSAAIGAIAEKPELLPRAMLFVALGEGLAVLGFAFAIWLLLRM